MKPFEQTKGNTKKPKYRTLSSWYHQNETIGKVEYVRRLESDETVVLNLDPDSDPFFIFLNSDIRNLAAKIQVESIELKDLVSSLPDRDMFLKDLMFTEIVSNNAIEGISCSKDELVGDEGNDCGLFHGQICSYSRLLKDESPAFPVSCSDIRMYYDSLLLEDMKMQDQSSLPDGFLFRKEPVIIHDGLVAAHVGVCPEEKIITMFENIFAWMCASSEPVVIQAAIFHYVFGYIHPFYDGNGRLNRFLPVCYWSGNLDLMPPFYFRRDLGSIRALITKLLRSARIHSTMEN